MSTDPNTELKRLKQEYLETERVHQEERDCLLRVIKTYGSVLAMHEEMAPELEILNRMVAAESTMPIDLIDVELGKLKDKILATESEQEKEAVSPDLVGTLEQRLIDACRAVRSMMNAILEDFYPLTDELAEMASSINLTCKDGVDPEEFDEATQAFLALVDTLKIKIGEDFRYINRAFIHLLDQVKDLEKTLSNEFGEKESLKAIEYLEMKVNSEAGSIVESFNIHRTIDEIKITVVEKIDNIKRLLSDRKREATRKAKSAFKSIQILKNRISEAEKSMLQVSKRAAQFQAAAEKDGLTGLHNRKAFDERITESLKGFHEHGIPLCLIILDVNDFKEINDTLGHVAGDKVLCKVAQCLVDSFRRDDFIARYGGDEFVVLIESLTGEMAMERILNFRKNLKRIRFTSYAKGDIHVSVSAGIALAKEGDTSETLIERADNIMYSQKKKKS